MVGFIYILVVYVLVRSFFIVYDFLYDDFIVLDVISRGEFSIGYRFWGSLADGDFFVLVGGVYVFYFMIRGCFLVSSFCLVGFIFSVFFGCFLY